MARAPRENTGQIVTRLFTGQRRGGQLVLQRLRGQWLAIVGEELATRTRPTKIHRGTLWIAVTDSSWSYELQFHKRELLAAIHAFLDSEEVAELRFQVGSVEPLPGEREPALPPERTALRAAPEAPLEAVSAVEHAASTITDETLRNVFVRSLSKQRRNRQPQNGAAQDSDAQNSDTQNSDARTSNPREGEVPE